MMRAGRPGRKKDLLLVAGLLTLALLLFALTRTLYSQPGDMVVVTVDNEVYSRMPLHKDGQLLITSAPGKTNLLVIQGGAAWIQEASCSNQVCVRSGSISQEGELIVCLPHKVVVSIEREE
jgi:hypothetical protein